MDKCFSFRAPALVVAERGLLLLSGGIDSPVAGRLMQERGLEVGAIHFSLEPLTDAAPEEKARRLARLLGFVEFLVCNAAEEMTAVASGADNRHYFVLSKRLMIRVAEAVARSRGYGFLITGENLGQVSSQTLPNLVAIDAAATLPILRPLLGWDKVEIVRRAEALGTFEISKGPEFCDVLGPEKPATAVTLSQAGADEAALGVPALVRGGLGKVRVEAPAPFTG